MRRPLLLLAVLATACGVAWRWTHPADLRLRVTRACDALLQGVEVPGDVTADALIAAAKRDKKVTGSKVRLVMLDGLGNLVQVPTVFDDSLIADLASYLAEGHGLRRN